MNIEDGKLKELIRIYGNMEEVERCYKSFCAVVDRMGERLNDTEKRFYVISMGYWGGQKRTEQRREMMP